MPVWFLFENAPYVSYKSPPKTPTVKSRWGVWGKPCQTLLQPHPLHLVIRFKYTKKHLQKRFSPKPAVGAEKITGPQRCDTIKTPGKLSCFSSYQEVPTCEFHPLGFHSSAHKLRECGTTTKSAEGSFNGLLAEGEAVDKWRKIRL